MKKIIYILFTLLFISSGLQAHKAHDDNLLKDLNGIISKKAFGSIKENIKDFSLESHYVYKNTSLDNKFLKILTSDEFNKKEYVSVLKEIYKDNEYIKGVNIKKSANIISKFSKSDRAVLANILKTLNKH